LKRLFVWVALIIALPFMINTHLIWAAENNADSKQVEKEKFEFD